MTTQTISHYGDVFAYVFDTMEMLDEELPEFWWEQPLYDDVQQSAYWQEQAWGAYKHDNGLTDGDEEDATQSDDYVEYELEYFDHVVMDTYVIYKVTGNNLDKLPDYVPVYWVDELGSYVFLQSWFGMAAYLIQVDPFTWEEKA